MDPGSTDRPIAVLIAGPRDMLRRPALWLGGPDTDLAGAERVAAAGDEPRVIAGEGVYTGGMLGFLPVGLLVSGLPIYLLEGRNTPWAQLWPAIRML